MSESLKGTTRSGKRSPMSSFFSQNILNACCSKYMLVLAENLSENPQQQISSFLPPIKYLAVFPLIVGLLTILLLCLVLPWFPLYSQIYILETMCYILHHKYFCPLFCSKVKKTEKPPNDNGIFKTTGGHSFRNLWYTKPNETGNKKIKGGH